MPLDRFELLVRVATEADRLAVVGPSGAGKTALVESIAGLRPARGRIAVGGRVLQDPETGVRLRPEERRVGYVPQAGGLFPHLSVRRNLLFGARDAGGEELEEVVEVLELRELLERTPRHLSGGESRLVALGRALLARPELLLLDEPTAGLDGERARRALGSIRSALERWRIPIVVVTHRQVEASALARELVVLDEGEVRASGRIPDAELAGVLGRHERIENVRWGPVRSVRPSEGVTTVTLDGVEFDAPSTDRLAVGEEVALAVAAEEIVVSRSRPEGLSARNAVRATISEILSVADSVLVVADDWVVRLTPASVRSLGLESGDRVWLLVKTHAWRLIAY